PSPARGRFPSRAGVRSERRGAAATAGPVEEPGELPHALEHDRVRTLEKLSRREPAGESEGAHARGARRLDAGAAVLDHHAGARLDAHPLCGLAEEVR